MWVPQMVLQRRLLLGKSFSMGSKASDPGKETFDHGHTHLKKQKEGYVNPLPLGKIMRSFEDGVFTIKDFEGKFKSIEL